VSWYAPVGSPSNSDHERVRDAIGWIAPHCDIEERLPLIPPSAQCRGLWFKILERQLQARGLESAYEERMPARSFSAVSFDSAADLCIRAAIGGALVAGPEDVHQGMFDLARDNSQRFATTLLGRTLLRLLARDPERLAKQAIASRRQTCNYGAWELVNVDASSVTVRYREEYLWIESYLSGASVGTFTQLGDDVRAEVEMDGPFHGTTTIRWR